MILKTVIMMISAAVLIVDNLYVIFIGTGINAKQVI